MYLWEEHIFWKRLPWEYRNNRRHTGNRLINFIINYINYIIDFINISSRCSKELNIKMFHHSILKIKQEDIKV